MYTVCLSDTEVKLSATEGKLFERNTQRKMSLKMLFGTKKKNIKSIFYIATVLLVPHIFLEAVQRTCHNVTLDINYIIYIFQTLQQRNGIC